MSKPAFPLVRHTFSMPNEGKKDFETRGFRTTSRADSAAPSLPAVLSPTARVLFALTDVPRKSATLIAEAGCDARIGHWSLRRLILLGLAQRTTKGQIRLAEPFSEFGNFQGHINGVTRPARLRFVSASAAAHVSVGRLIDGLGKTPRHLAWCGRIIVAGESSADAPMGLCYSCSTAFPDSTTEDEAA